MASFVKFFLGSTIFAVVALCAAFILGWVEGGPSLAFDLAFTALMLGVLETSLSFDNAVVNAKVLGTMTAFWRKMFLTLGVLIAVFGMRIVFPLVLVWMVSSLPVGEVFSMTWQNPRRFQEILVDQQVVISGFGGAFLWMVFSRFFLDANKSVHWLPGLEPFLARLGSLPALGVLLTLGLTLILGGFLPEASRAQFLQASVLGVLTFVAVDGLGRLLRTPRLVVAGGLGGFIYLEILDASFSMDGVIGAFAITDNLYVIALGLGIGAFFVRSMTLKLVEDGTLGTFLYLEHGAFWAIGVLALIMFLKVVSVEVPELVAGTAGMVLIGLSFWSSVRHNHRR